MARYLKLPAGVVASGVLLYLALPLGEQAYLAWFCLVPLLIVSRDRGFLVGCLCAIGTLGLATFLAILGPTYAHRDSRGDPAMVIAGFAQFGVSLGVTTAIWSDKTLNRRPSWWFAALATLLEASLLLTLPANIALTQYRQSMMLLIASLGGIWLVSFLVYWANFLLAQMKISWALPAALGLAAPSLGLSHLGPTSRGEEQRFAAIQVSEPDSDTLTRLQTNASSGLPSLVVWPELSGAAMAHGTDTLSLCELSREPKVAAFVTSYEDDWPPRAHNVSAVFWRGRHSALYAKRKMFGTEGSLHTPGNRPVAVRYPGGTVALAICFDSCYPEAMRDSARLPGVDLIALPTVDPFASNHFIAGMHAAYSSFRCAEEGRAMVRADGRAYSQLVDSYGNIVAELPPGDGILSGSLSTATHWTLYRQFGDWFLLVCGALVIWPLLPAKVRQFRPPLTREHR